MQFPLPHDLAHQAAAAHKDSMGAIIRELAGYAGAEDPEAFAQEMSLLMKGAYVTRQVARNPATAAIVRRMINMLVVKYLPAARSCRDRLDRVSQPRQSPRLSHILDKDRPSSCLRSCIRRGK